MGFRGQVISISGLDGCGKTTIIEALQEVLSEQGKPSRYVWLRYNHYLTKILLAFCRLVGLTKYKTAEGVRIGYHNFHRSTIVSYLFIWLTYIDTVLATLVTIYFPALLSPAVIICDRWVLDIMVDLEVDTRIRFSRGSALNRMFMRLIPHGSHCFLVYRSEAAVKGARKENVVDRNFPERVRLYEEHANEPIVQMIDNNGPVRAAVDKIMAALK